MPGTKQDYFKKQYIKQLIEGKEVHQKRKDYLSNFSLFPAIADLLNGEFAPELEEGQDSGTMTGGTGVIINGKMPTINEYDGPDDYFDTAINAIYQTGLAARIRGTDKWNDSILKVAQKLGVNPIAVKLIMAIESSGNHSNIPNSANCVGLMQCQGATVTGIGRDWNKTKNDPEYNIETGCFIMLEKHEYAKRVIKNNGQKYREYKSQGAELKVNVHGASWMYNGFTHVTNASNKVKAGFSYANQIAAMYAGFGRDAHIDTFVTTDVLSSGSPSGSGIIGSASRFIIQNNDEVQPRPNNESFSPDMSPPTPDELAFMRERRAIFNLPIGYVKSSYFHAPQHNRNTYVAMRRDSETFQYKEGYAPVPLEAFTHINGPQENLYSEETRDMLLLLKRTLGMENISIVRGFDSTNLNSSHSIGIAVDVFSETAERALMIADTAWFMGVRSIAIGPGFVHLDAGPENTWGYGNIPSYRGPGSIRIEELKRHAF